MRRSHVCRASRKATQAVATAAKSSKFDYDLVIIGCGVGGHGAALHAVESVRSMAPDQPHNRLVDQLQGLVSHQVLRLAFKARMEGCFAHSQRCHCILGLCSGLPLSSPASHCSGIVLVEQGLKVAVIEGHDIGGTCVNRGCVPSKALLAASGRVREFRDQQHLKSMGIQVRVIL